MKFWWAFFKDKRFAWDFKIANFIMRDDLRNYLAVDCAMLQEICENRNCADYEREKISRVIRDLHRLMKGV